MVSSEKVKEIVPLPQGDNFGLGSTLFAEVEEFADDAFCFAQELLSV